MSDLERIAKLEAQHEELMRLMKETHDDLKEVKQSLTKWKGITTGVILTVSVIWTAIMAVIAWVRS